MRLDTNISAILQEIVRKKKQVPLRNASRLSPLQPPNLEKPLVIAEIKRASPSAGNLSTIPNPLELANSYQQGGAGAISILCEGDYFKGDLEDLKAVKSANPNLCLLRKDFITEIGQIAESYAFGADMVLLIAAVFMGEDNENGGFARLQALYEECLKFHLTPLIEVHNALEVDFIRPLKACLIGVNARNLHTFKINKIQAYQLLPKIQAENPQAKVIFESSLSCSFDGFVVGSLGFDGILCGSYLVRSSQPEHTLHSLKNALEYGRETQNTFYKQVFNLLDSKLGFIKICGITNTEDALMCAESLQNLQQGFEKVAALGFILEPKSPRYVDTQTIKIIAKELQQYPNILKIAVLKDNAEQMQNALQLYQEGIIDALQLHGVKTSGKFANLNLKEANFAFYEAWNVEKQEDLGEFFSPFVLVDSKSHLGGGSGYKISENTLKSLHLEYLCVAGGVGVDNIESLKNIGAKMLDINSSIEKSAGQKDKDKLHKLIQKLKNYL